MENPYFIEVALYGPEVNNLYVVDLAHIQYKHLSCFNAYTNDA